MEALEVGPGDLRDGVLGVVEVALGAAGSGERCKQSDGDEQREQTSGSPH